MKEFYKSAGYRIRKYRELQHLSREQLAELADISPKFLYEIETGKKGFSAGTLFHIVTALSIDSDVILKGEQEKTKQSFNCNDLNKVIKQLTELVNFIK